MKGERKMKMKVSPEGVHRVMNGLRARRKNIKGVSRNNLTTWNKHNRASNLNIQSQEDAQQAMEEQTCRETYLQLFPLRGATHFGKIFNLVDVFQVTSSSNFLFPFCSFHSIMVMSRFVSFLASLNSERISDRMVSTVCRSVNLLEACNRFL